MKPTHLIIGIVAVLGFFIISAKLLIPPSTIAPSPTPVPVQTLLPSPTPEEKSSAECPKPGITVLEPKPNTNVDPTFTVRAVVDNRGLSLECRWGVFEAQAGTMEVVSSDGLVGRGILMTSEDWMNDGPINFSGEIELENHTTVKGDIKLSITEDDPSGLKTPKSIFIPLRHE